MTATAPLSTQITVALVEDDPGIRDDLLRIIQQASDIRCMALCDSAESALQQLPKISPQVVLMDINLPKMSGVECVRHLLPLLPHLQVIMLTVNDDTDVIFNALAAGAMGYLLKPVRQNELLAAIRDVSTGGSPMTSGIARKVVQAFKKPPATQTPTDKLDTLTPREREVLECLAKGFLYKEVADHLGISYNTVLTLIRRIYEKLQVHSRHAAVTTFFTDSHGKGAP